MANKRAGFTLIELLVVVLIIGILAAVAVPNYVKSVEVTKADDAVALVNMIGTTNRMFALDHGNSYIVGTFPATAGDSCGTGTCPASGPGSACALVWCKYLADQDFGSKPYTFYACSGGVCSTGGGSGVAGAHRKATASTPYSTWDYVQSAQGVITGYGTSVPAPTY